MRLNINQLIVFYLAARYKSMTEAAKRLYVSTPAVTMQIKKIEQWLGFSLFQRSKNGITLTEKGTALYKKIDPVFQELEKIERYVEDLVLSEGQTIKLGTHHIPGNFFIPELIANVSKQDPHLKIVMELDTQDKLLALLEAQKLDVSLIIGDLPQNSNCGAIPMFNEPMALVVNAHSKLAKISSIVPHELANLPLILQQKGTGARRTVLAFFEQHDVKPNILLENLSSDVIKNFLGTVDAAALISKFIVQEELNKGILHEIHIQTNTPPFCRFSMAYYAKANLPIKTRNFLEAIEGFSLQYHSRNS